MSGREVEEEIAVRRPRREVFAFVADPEHRPAWRNGVRRVRRISEFGYEIEVRRLGRRTAWTYEITAQEPGVLLSGRMTPVTAKAAAYEEAYTFEGTDDRAWVRLSITAQPDGPRALVVPLAQWAMRRQVRASLRRLRAVLEGPAVADLPNELPEEEPVTPG